MSHMQIITEKSCNEQNKWNDRVQEYRSSVEPASDIVSETFRVGRCPGSVKVR